MLQPRNPNDIKMWVIYEKHESYIYQSAYGTVRNEEDAENITQMCFLKIFSEYKKLRKLQEEEARKYVETVAQSTIAAYCQREKGGRK